MKSSCGRLFTARCPDLCRQASWSQRSPTKTGPSQPLVLPFQRHLDVAHSRRIIQRHARMMGVATQDDDIALTKPSALEIRNRTLWAHSRPGAMRRRKSHMCLPLVLELIPRLPAGYLQDDCLAVRALYNSCVREPVWLRVKMRRTRTEHIWSGLALESGRQSGCADWTAFVRMRDTVEQLVGKLL